MNGQGYILCCIHTLSILLLLLLAHFHDLLTSLRRSAAVAGADAGAADGGREGSDGLATAQTRLKMLLFQVNEEENRGIPLGQDDKSRLTWPFLYPFRRRRLQLGA